MSDRGLQEAIRAAGGVTELARRIGVTQPSVSNWRRVPAERVLAVEEVTGVARDLLRPDLYADNQCQRRRRRSRARAASTRCSAPCSRARRTPICWRASASLRGDATPLGLAHIELAEAARNARVERVEQEFFDLFIGVGRGELLPYGSYYLTGFLHERPLARLREDLARFGIDRAEGVAEPEDHAGNPVRDHGRAWRAANCRRRRDRIALSSKSTWRRGSAVCSPTSSARRRRISTGASAALGRVFIEIETEAFALPTEARGPGQTLDQGGLAMKSKTKMGRRDFLRVLGAGAGAAAAPAALVSEAEGADRERR